MHAGLISAFKSDVLLLILGSFCHITVRLVIVNAAVAVS